MKERLRVLFSLLLTTVLIMSLFTGLVSGKQVKNDEHYDYQVKKDVMVEMRDGVKLSTDLYLPTPTSKKEEVQGFPTLVLRTPYNKDTYGGAEGPVFAKKGYAVVVQDTRGRYKSEGDWNFVFDDANDGYDLIEWAAAQEFSNGKVGTMGLSYMAYTQYVLAKSKPPHLVTMIPLEGASNFAEEVFFTGGAMQLDRYLSWTLGQSQDTARCVDEQNGNTYYQDQLANVNYQELLHYTPRNGITLLNELQGWWKEALQNPEYGPYWKQISPQEWHNSWPVPTMLGAGMTFYLAELQTTILE